MFVAHQSKPTSKIVGITQDIHEYKRLACKFAAFRDWQQKLNRGDRLPRGKYFNCSKPRKPVLIIDEAWSFLSNQ